jgi:hypothetical protein
MTFFADGGYLIKNNGLPDIRQVQGCHAG